MKTAPDFQCLSIARAVAYLGDEVGVMTLMPSLRLSLNNDLARIQQGLVIGDVPEVQACLHQLKGFIPVFCTDALIAEVAALEALCKHAGVQQVRTAYAALAPQLAQLQAEVDSHMAARA